MSELFMGACRSFMSAAALLLIFVVPADAADTSADWIGRRCLAKNLAVQVYDGSQVVGTAKDLDPVFQVVQIEGSWLSVHSAAITGWIRLDDVVPLDGALAFFNDLIRRDPANLAAYTA